MMEELESSLEVLVIVKNVITTLRLNDNFTSNPDGGRKRLHRLSYHKCQTSNDFSFKINEKIP